MSDAQSTPTLDALSDALFAKVENEIARLYLDPTTARRLAAEVGRRSALDSGSLMDIPYVVTPNVEGWCFVDAEGNVVKAGPSPAEETSGG